MLTSILDVFKPSALDLEFLARLAMAVVLGGVIGLEREVHDKPAGFRTIILICVGACVFTIVSQAVGGLDLDTTRIAAQVVTGIGFLGAGAIIRDRQSVFGLTTAATIWAVAAIGMAVGFGEYLLGVSGTLSILVALFVFDAVEHWISRLRDIQDYHFSVPKTPEAIEEVRAMFAKAELKTKSRDYYEEDENLVFYVRAMGTKASHERLRTSLARSSEYRLRRP